MSKSDKNQLNRKKKVGATQTQLIVAENLRDCAIRLHIEGDLINAEKKYREAIRLGYYHSSIFINLGVICKNSGRLEEAVILYK